jgi:Tfp pilus assembly protein PilF
MLIIVKIYQKYKFIASFFLYLITIVIFQIQSCKTNNQGFSNLAEEVQYVGMQKCASCHDEIYRSYIRTGMGRSFYKPIWEERIEDLEQIVYDSYSDYYYQPFWKDKEFCIKEFRKKGNDTIYQRVEKIDYIIGSGNQTRSYLILRNGFLYEAPITWYVARKKWDLSPGYEAGKNSRFERPIGYECMACHNAYPQIIPGSINKYERIPLGIDCERCHGPGQLHVKAMERDEIVDVEKEIDYTIVNPSKLSIDLQFDVCQQCHLQGIVVRNSRQEFRPGMPLSKSFDVFIPERKDSSSFGIASHAERLRFSKCFQKSKMTCITCHDPHKSIHGNPITFYKNICEKCHNRCSAPKAELEKKEHNCVICHMPKGNTSDIPHVNFTDHFIRTLPPSTQNARYQNAVYAKEKKEEIDFVKLLCATSSSSSSNNLGKAYLIYYEQQESNPAYLKLALSYLAEDSYYERSKVLFYQRKLKDALSLAQKAKAQKPNDPFVIFHLVNVLESLDKSHEALQELSAIIRRYPDLVEAYARAAALLLRQTKDRRDEALIEQARDWLQKAYRIKPRDIPTLNNLAFICLNTGELAKAYEFINAVLALEPDNPKALENIIYYFLLENQAQKAAPYLSRLEKIDPVLADRLQKKIK